MNLEQIKIKASNETLDITKELILINNAIEEYPNGMDLSISGEAIDAVVHYCDKNNIAVYHVTRDCISVAKTYKKLLAHENSR